MIYIRRYILLCLMVFAYGQHFELPGEVTKVGTAAANWLKLDSGSRGIAMGGAQTAAGVGVSGIPYNPASIAFIEGSSTYYSQSSYLLGITHNVLAYGSNISPTNYIGLHLFYLDSGDMPVTTEQYPDGTGEDFNMLGLAFRFTYAKMMTDRLPNHLDARVFSYLCEIKRSNLQNMMFLINEKALYLATLLKM